MMSQHQPHQTISRDNHDPFGFTHANNTSFTSTPLKQPNPNESHNGFGSPSFHSSSKINLVKEVIDELDREILTRKKELSALKSRSANKRRLTQRNHLTPVMNQQIKELLSPTATEELVKDLMRLSSEAGVLNHPDSSMVVQNQTRCDLDNIFEGGDEELKDHLASSLQSKEGDAKGEKKEKGPIIYDLSNIQDDMSVEDATVEFGGSRYDHINLSIHSPSLDAASTHSASKALVFFPSSSEKSPPSHPNPHFLTSPPPLAVEDISSSHPHPPAEENDQNYDTGNHYPVPLIAISREEEEGRGRRTLSGSVSQDDPLLPSSKDGATVGHQNHNNLSYSHSLSHSHLSLASSSGASHVTTTAVEVETYKMKYHTMTLKYNILKKDFEEMAEKMQRTINEHSSLLSSLRGEKAKLEQDKLLHDEEVLSLKEELLFVRSQLQTKSARVTDLEAELLISHKYAHSMHSEMVNYRSSLDSAVLKKEAEENEETILMKEQFSQLNQQLKEARDDNRKLKKQIAEHLENQQQLTTQIEDLHSRLEQTDHRCFEVETVNAQLEGTIEQLMRDKDSLAQALQAAEQSAANPKPAITPSEVVTGVKKEKLVLITRENSRDHKLQGIRYQHRYSLTSLLFLIAILQTAVWTLLIASVYFYLLHLDHDPSLYRLYRITS